MNTDEIQVLSLPFMKGRQITEADLTPLLEGNVLLPNFEAITADKAVTSAATYYGHIKQGRAKLNSNYPGQALFFFKCGQGGGFTGEGMVMATGPWVQGVGYTSISGTFAICKHQHVEGTGANHSWGWHPGYCKLCGLDLSVDSGD